MLIRKSLLAFAAITPLLGGCTSAVIQTPTLSAMPLNDYEKLYQPNELMHGERARFYLHPLPTDIQVIAERGKSLGIPIAHSIRFRNFVQNELLKRSDQICTAYITRLVHGFVVGNAGVKLGESILKIAIAPLAIADATVQTLSGTVTSQVSNEILQHEQFIGVNRRILSNRAANRANIMKWQDRPIGGYSLSRAIYDAELYHSYCNYATQYVAGESPAQPVLEEPKLVEDPKLVKATAGGK